MKKMIVLEELKIFFQYNLLIINSKHPPHSSAVAMASKNRDFIKGCFT